MGIDTETDIASEFRYRNPPLDPKRYALLPISQSGGATNTLAALDLVKSKKVPTLGTVNVVGSPVARNTNAGIYHYAGPKIGVATTKVISSQLTILVTPTVWLGQPWYTLTASNAKKILTELAILLKKSRSCTQQYRCHQKYRPTFLSTTTFCTCENLQYADRI